MQGAPKLRLVEGGAASPEDAELLRSFFAGNTEAFGELVKRHQELVYKLCRRYSKDADDAYDLTQRAFLQAFQAARRNQAEVKGESGFPFRAWLVRIAVNLGKNQVRDAGRWAKAPVEVLEAERSVEASPQEKLERAEAQQRTREAVLDLPKRQREVLSLRVDGDLPFAEVARLLGISEANAKTHFHYAVKRLKELVRAAAGGES
jgi:RNA polymerase sigma-70 factor (ECF subfamily)